MNLAQLAQLLQPAESQLRSYSDGEIVLIAGTSGTIDRRLQVHVRLPDRKVLHALRVRSLLVQLSGGAFALQREPVDEEVGLLRQLVGLYGGAR